METKSVVFVPLPCPTAKQAVDKDKNPGQNLLSFGTFMAPSIHDHWICPRQYRRPEA